MEKRKKIKEKLTKEELKEIGRLKKKYSQYEKVKNEDILKLERIRRLIARMRGY